MTYLLPNYKQLSISRGRVLLYLNSRASFIPPLAQMQVTFQKRSIAAQVRGRPTVFHVLRIYVM